MPYGLTFIGSAERAAYAQHLQGYLAATLLPLLDAWQGELPDHLHKVPRCRPCYSALLLLTQLPVLGNHTAQPCQETGLVCWAHAHLIMLCELHQ